MLQPVQRQSIRIRNTMYVEVKLPVNNEINVKFCRVSVVIHPMTHWQYEILWCVTNVAKTSVSTLVRLGEMLFQEVLSI